MSSNDPPSSPSWQRISPHRLPIAKVNAVARFKSFSESLLPKRKPAPITFPPPSWNIEDINPSSINWTIPPKPESPAPEPAPVLEPSAAPTNTAVQDNVEPMTFARRLRAMIELLPIPGNFASVPSADPASASPAPEIVKETTPPVPPGIDEGLVRMLSSEELMNGDVDTETTGRGRASIWNILAGLRQSDKDDKVRSGEKNVISPVEEEEDGIMMYAPLEPKADSQIELARFVDNVGAEPSSSDYTPPSSATSTPEILPVEKGMWVPSTTELSVFTAWWGYRLYLPPPVMAELGASTIKAAARAAMLTGALKWMLGKIPLLLVPPQFRPALKMLKSLTPVAGYVGVFIAWSWDRIRTLDEGNGVVLTATWLLPVALLPMAWDAGDIFGPHLPPPEVEDDSDSLPSIKDKKEQKEQKQKSRFW